MVAAFSYQKWRHSHGSIGEAAIIISPLPPGAINPGAQVAFSHLKETVRLPGKIETMKSSIFFISSREHCH